MNEIRRKFLFEANEVITQNKSVSVLVIVIVLPSGAHEVIVNQQNVASKLNDLVERYNDNFCLKSNPQVKIVGYVLV